MKREVLLHLPHSRQSAQASSERIGLNLTDIGSPFTVRSAVGSTSVEHLLLWVLG
jgi:hypothetical protein